MIKRVTINDLVTFRANATGVYGLKKIDGLATAPYRTTTITYGGRDGGSTPMQKRAQRLIAIEGDITNNSPEDHGESRELLIQALSFNESVPLVIEKMDGTTYLTWVKFQQPQMPIDAPNSTDVQLIAIADDWRLFETSGTINSATVQKMVSGGARWRTSTDGAGWRWLSTSGLRWTGGAGAVNVVNAGDTAANPTITITGANQNPVIRNETTGEQIKVNITTGSTDVLVIDTNLKATLLNGGNISALVEPGSTYFTLRPGDNLITLTNDNSSGGEALIEWYDAVTGV